MDIFGRSILTHKVEEITGSREFTYVTAVTMLKGDKAAWENHELFLRRLQGNKIKVVTFEDMLELVYPKLKLEPAFSTIGRVLQLMKASGWQLPRCRSITASNPFTARKTEVQNPAKPRRTPLSVHLATCASIRAAKRFKSSVSCYNLRNIVHDGQCIVIMENFTGFGIYCFIELLLA